MNFSVVVPTYNRPEKLNNCLSSILSQEYRGEFEIIMVEDDASEKSKPIIDSLNQDGKIRYFSQNHKGPAVARNFGVSKAIYDYIAFTDDDCVVPANWLSAIESGFKQYKNAGAVGGFMEAPTEVLKQNVFSRYESFMTRTVYGTGSKEIFGGFEVPTGGTNNIAYKKSVLSEIKGFDETFPVAAGEDADLKLRVVSKGYKILYIPLKVEHFHLFGWKSFIRQSWIRGIGSYYFHQKHGGGLGLFGILGMLFLLPLIFINDLRKGIPLQIALLKKIACFFDFVSQLKWMMIPKK